MKKPNLLAALLLLATTITSAHAVDHTLEMTCYNNSAIGPLPVELKLNRTGGQLTYRNESCAMRPISYKPRSDKYAGWVRVGAARPFCPKVGKLMFGGTSSKSGPSVYWLSISPEVAKGTGGFVQLGYENQWDPGAGPEAKTFLRCYPKR